jgi:hypothetical protein
MVSENKTVAGFHLLMVLSQVDGHFSEEESEVAARYVSKHFKDDFLLEAEAKNLKELNPKDYFSHFRKCMDTFYSKSSSAERAGLVKFAVDMVKADSKITAEENVYLNELLNSWEPEHSG